MHFAAVVCGCRSLLWHLLTVLCAACSGQTSSKQGRCGWENCPKGLGGCKPMMKVTCSQCINRKKNPQGFCCHAHWKECHPVV